MPKYPVKYKGKNVKNKEGQQKYRVFVSYTCNETGEHKKLSQVVFGQEDAKTVERNFERQIKEGGHIQQRMTVQQLYDEYMASKKRSTRESTLESNRRDYRLHIEPMLADVYIDALTVRLFQKWKIYIEGKEQLALRSRQHAYGTLRAMLNWGVKMEYIEKNNLTKLGTFTDSMYVKPKVKFYTAEEFKKFISVAKEHAEEHEQKHKDYSEWEYYVFFNILFYTGLRKGECHGLRWSDIDFESALLNVERSILQKYSKSERVDIITPPKTKSSIRTLQIPQPLIDILKTHKERKKQLRGFSEDDLICSNGDRCLRDGSIYNRKVQFAELAGIKQIRVHDFRHSHVSVLANAGINIQEIARRLGHTRVEETWNTYSHLYSREEEKAVDILNAIA